MSNQVEVIFIGAGGHASVLYEIMSKQNYSIKAIYSKSDVKIANIFKSLNVNMNTIDPVLFESTTYKLVNGVGYIPYSTARFDVWDLYKKLDYKFASVVASSSDISTDAVLGEGVQIMKRVVISVNVTIGANTIVNTGAIIEHDSEIGASCHIAPGAILCGNVKIKDYCFIGAGATIFPGVKLPKHTIVPAGAVISKER